MKVYTHTQDLQKEIALAKKSQYSIGFVPTMGALHKGHISLVERAKNETDICVVSIFVNPTQFNNLEDLQKYPRTLTQDLEMLQSEGCNMVFVPKENEIYPEKDTRTFNFGHLENTMEGEFRPGHFNGVAQVVSKLFEIITPNKAYFGEKDFQQLAIVREMTAMLFGKNIEIVGCPTMRDDDGLAMSSRNVRLSSQERINASLIPKMLFMAQELQQKMSVQQIKKQVKEAINNNPYLKTEYFNIVDAQSLKDINNWSDSNNRRACIAVYVGEVRLIDNIKI